VTAPSVACQVVEVFADVTCPFAHLGLQRFVAHRDARAAVSPLLRVRAWPLELVNGQPLDPGVVARHVAELREQVAPDLFQQFDPSHLPPSSMPWLDVVAAAYQLGDAPGERMSLLVREALFEMGLDLANPEVLIDLAATEGISVPTMETRQLVLADYEDGRRRGVRGSPEFFLDGRGWYCPSLQIEKVGEDLRIQPDVEQIEEFLAACFG
jgi:predicted DsbA family dithiol-disulfide isomerase